MPTYVFLCVGESKICLKFAKQCLRNEKLKDMFPRTQSNHKMSKRHKEKYLLNRKEREKTEIFSRIKNTVPVNYGSLYASSLIK